MYSPSFMQRFNLKLVKNKLAKWGYYELNFDYLTDSEIEDMKTLYAALKQLSKDDFCYLGCKYRVPVGSLKKNDREVADQLNLSFKEFSERRKIAELKVAIILDLSRLDNDETDWIEEVLYSSNEFSNQKVKHYLSHWANYEKWQFISNFEHEQKKILFECLSMLDKPDFDILALKYRDKKSNHQIEHEISFSKSEYTRRRIKAEQHLKHIFENYIGRG